MQTTGIVIVALAGLGISIVDLLYLLTPQSMAANFGLPSIPGEDSNAWLRVKGIRDFATGVVAGVLIIAASSTVLGWAVLAFTIIPIGDALIVLRSGGRRAAVIGIHGLTAALMLLASGLLLIG
jgi:hypothetical protein